MKKFVAGFLIIIGLGQISCNKSTTPSSGVLTEVTDATAFKDELKSGVTAVFFHATWCSRCAAQRPAIEALAEDGNFDGVYFGEVDYEKFNGIAKDLNVTGFPTILFIKDNVELKRYEGSGHSLSKLKQDLETLL